MKKWLILLFILLSAFSSTSYSTCKDEPVKIAVVDTGFGYHGHGIEAKLCKSGHVDFTTNQKPSDSVPLDTIGHGTNIVGIIESYAKKTNVNYCVVILKYYRDDNFGINNLMNSIAAFKYATVNGIKYINYSAGGKDASDEEKEAVEDFLNKGGTFITAAGNGAVELGKNGTYYPAMYDKRIIIVGSTYRNGTHLLSSNYGKLITRWEFGCPVTAFGITMCGTSQATATASGKILSQNPNKCDIK